MWLLYLVIKNFILTRILCRSFLSFTAKSLGQSAVRPGVFPHEPHRGRLLWLGVSEPSKDDGEWGAKWKWNGASPDTSPNSEHCICLSSSLQVWLDHIKPIIKQLRRECVKMLSRLLSRNLFLLWRDWKWCCVFSQPNKKSYIFVLSLQH